MPLNTKEIDLHGLSADDALFRLEQEIPTVYSRGIDQLLIIYGKGEGILKGEVLHFLRSAACRKYVQTIQPGEKYNLPGGEGVVNVIFKHEQGRIRGQKVVPLKRSALSDDASRGRIHRVPTEQDRKLLAEKKEKGKQKYLKRVRRLKST